MGWLGFPGTQHPQRMDRIVTIKIWNEYFFHGIKKKSHHPKNKKEYFRSRRIELYRFTKGDWRAHRQTHNNGRIIILMYGYIIEWIMFVGKDLCGRSHFFFLFFSFFRFAYSTRNRRRARGGGITPTLRTDDAIGSCDRQTSLKSPTTCSSNRKKKTQKIGRKKNEKRTTGIT